ncbi:MAG: MFS transporter [Dehalococcoidia bacterium]
MNFNSLKIFSDNQIYSKRLFFSVLVPSFFVQFGVGMLLPIEPIFISDLNVGIALVGLGLSGILIGNTLFDIPSGIMIKKIGHDKTMLLSVFIVSISSIITGFVSSFLIFFILRIITGCGLSMWDLSRMSYISDTVPNNQRGKALASLGGVHRIGLFIGPIAGGLIGANISTGYVFVIQGLLVGLILFCILPNLNSIKFKDIHTNNKPKSINILIKENKGIIIRGSIAIMSLQMVRKAKELLLPLWGLYLGLNVDEIGYVIGASSALDMILFLPAGYIMDKRGRKWMSIPTCFILALGLFLIPLTGNIWSFVAVSILIGFGNGLGSGAMMVLGSDLAPPGYSGEFLGIWKLIGDTSASSTPILIGQIANILTLGISSVFMGVIGVVGGLGMYLFVPETLNKDKK